MAFLQPERYFSRLTRVNIRHDLCDAGFENVLLDIDNTILSRDTNAVPRDVGLWLAQARDAGIVFCFLSNNWHKNVHELAAELELPIVAKAMKPCPAAFFMALRTIGAKRSNTVMIGDQLMTDVLGAHLAGIKAYLIAPLVEQDLPHTLMLRTIERAVMRTRLPEEESTDGVRAFESLQAIAIHDEDAVQNQCVADGLTDDASKV